MPSHTPLRKSILTQAKNGDSLPDLTPAIDADFERDYNTFGSIYVGNKWVLEVEIIRISRIQGIFTLDYGAADYVLALVGHAQTLWVAGLEQQHYRNAAATYLKSICPNAATGNDVETYRAFLTGQLTGSVIATNPEAAYEAASILPNDTQFSFIQPSGVPTPISPVRKFWGSSRFYPQSSKSPSLCNTAASLLVTSR